MASNKFFLNFFSKIALSSEKKAVVRYERQYGYVNMIDFKSKISKTLFPPLLIYLKVLFF